MNKHFIFGIVAFILYWLHIGFYDLLSFRTILNLIFFGVMAFASYFIPTCKVDRFPKVGKFLNSFTAPIVAYVILTLIMITPFHLFFGYTIFWIALLFAIVKLFGFSFYFLAMPAGYSLIALSFVLILFLNYLDFYLMPFSVWLGWIANIFLTPEAE